MSCDVAVAAFLTLASAGPSAPTPYLQYAVAAPQTVASEPLFVDIVGKAGALKAQVDRYRAAVDLKGSPAPVTLPGIDRFQSDVAALSALDMQGHLELAKRGTDGDLKCILRGISQDLPLKLHEVMAAPSGAAEDEALRDMAYLLNDTVEVLTAPPAPPV
ncbi:MAG: hypothetical protein ACXWKY_20075 [Caulobacteraceae bacterium]